MSEFKSQAEVWQALLDGKVVADISLESKYKFVDGCCFTASLDPNCVYQPSSQSFYRYEKYNSYIETKSKKIVRMAPVLIFFNNRYHIGDHLYPSEKQAKEDNGEEFRKWLIDTHAIDVEVDDG
jgi:hypothetical protein